MALDPFIGQIMVVGFGFPPRGWATCDGQLLAISQYSALFSLLGTTYGGDGRTTFGLPDLRGRDPIGVGTGPGLSPVSWGQRSGNENTTLTVNNLPPHNHAVGGQVSPQAASDGGLGTDANGRYLGPGSFYSAAGDNVNMAPIPAAGLTTVNTGAGQAYSNRSPYLGMYYCIALVGVFPSRN